jgi:beta-1,2-mannobiose phosphorylase / 1,2-beta-oligomannan phosphorylase
MDFAPHVYIIGLVCFVLILAIWVFSALKRGPRKTPPVEKQKFTLDRHKQNPVVSPRPHNEWEANGTLNPAVVADTKGKVHLLYRSVGSDGLSQIGHAKSNDGYNFDTRSSFPVYQPESGLPQPEDVSTPATYNQAIYTSGGGWGGFEDPRAVVIDDYVYMTYINFAGWDSVRIGLTSLKITDLEEGRWNWKKPKFLSPANQVNKNWLLFPEKINGKYAILHGLSPKILVDYLDDINDFISIKEIKSAPQHHGRGYEDPSRAMYWDNWVKGGGPPPIKTEQGWLLLYHALDKRDPGKYKLGAMLLDLNDPTKMLYRSPKPILEPDMPYENDGKPGVVYATGTLIKEGNLVIYYGGGDKHICIAQTPLNQLLTWLTTYGKI